VNADEDHRAFDRKLSDMERRAQEQAALLRRMQIELEIFVEEEEEANTHSADHFH